MHTRHLLPLLEEALTDTPVVVLSGARQTGKSTLAQSLSSHDNRRYLTLDDPVVLAAATGDAAGFIGGLEGPVVLDEIQRAPELFLAIKAAVDRDRTPGRFLLTGSANVMLLPRVADSLAGRMQILSLWPLSCAEQEDMPQTNLADWLFSGELALKRAADDSRTRLIQYLVGGGYPEAVSRNSPNRRAAWFDSYLQAILERDVRELANLEQFTQMPHLLKLLATRSGSLLNFSEISRASGLTQTTLKRYFALLETLFLVYRLPSWERNPGKRLVKAPKIFLPDCGMLAHLTGQTGESLCTPQGLPGGLVETFVLGELLKHLSFSQLRLQLWHYRTQTNMEVDFVLENPMGKITGIEVKASRTVDGKDFKGLRHLQETEPQVFQRGIVLYGGNEIIPFGPALFAVPLSMWWSGTGL